jgi:hypothetical protein
MPPRAHRFYLFGILAKMLRQNTIIAAARGWKGTPYHHQASLKGVGCDCLGLIRGVWRELHGAEPEVMPAYTKDWNEATGAEALLDAGRWRRHLLLITGGFAKGYRTQILGVTTALSTIALWAVGEMTLPELISSLPLAFGGLGLAALGAKVNNAKAAKA